MSGLWRFAPLILLLGSCTSGDDTWVANRILQSDIWLFSCKDGTTFTQTRGFGGPTFGEATTLCSKHGGFAQPTEEGRLAPGNTPSPTKYLALAGAAARVTSSISVQDLVGVNAITRQEAFTLTGSSEPSAWQTSPVSLQITSEPPQTGSVFVTAHAVQRSGRNATYQRSVLWLVTPVGGLIAAWVGWLRKRMTAQTAR